MSIRISSGYAQVHEGLDLNPDLLLLFVLLGVFLLLLIVISVLFLSLFRPWLQGYLSGAHISVLDLIGMTLRRVPVKKIVHCRIMAVHSGLNITTRQLESAYLQAVDVDRAVLAMIQAKETGKDLSWEDIISADTNERLRKMLYDE